uniref:hypothetical protein n=1 Tax=Acetatifactor sp. TaxID=1872090 RepID=UPI0040563C4A
MGWTGLIPIAVLIEYVLGIQADRQKNEIVWRINRTERHGIERYPFGDKLVDLVCEAREGKEKEPQVTIHCAAPVTVRIIWERSEKLISHP